MKIHNNLIVVLFIIFVMALIIIYALNNKKEADLRQVIHISLDKCQSQLTGCVVKLNEFNIKLYFDKNIYYLKHFMISAISESTTNSKIESVYVDFKMKGMDLGINRFRLANSSSSSDKQVWKGKAILPICVTGRVDWISEVEVVTKQYKYILSIPILVKQPNS